MINDKQKEMFLAKIELLKNGCAEWQAATSKKGYSVFGIGTTLSKNGKITGKLAYGHRISYVLYREAIPKGMVIDHMCRNRKCVNPYHLRCVSPRINSIENNIHNYKLECNYGHKLSADNIAIYRNVRCCKTCNRVRKNKNAYSKTKENS